MNIENATVLITGANRGIGKTYVEGFLKAGAAKIYLAVRDPSKVEDMIAANPDKLVALKLDVTNPGDVRAAVSAAKDINILVNNAGVLEDGSLQDSDALAKSRKEMEVNYFGVLAMINAFAPVLKANGGGALVTVSSIAGHVSFPGLGTYCASKAATHSLIMAARAELNAQGTLVVGVYPGPIETDMTSDLEMDTVPPEQVADTTIQAIINGQEDVFTDDFSASTYESFKKDPKGVEAQMLEMMAHAA